MRLTVKAATADDLRWFCTELKYAPHMDLKGITAWNEAGEREAIIGYDCWTFNSVHLHIWLRSKWSISRSLIKEAFRFPFDNGRNVLIGVTPSYNLDALRFNKSIGFVETYRIRDGHTLGGDLVIQELRREDCTKWAG